MELDLESSHFTYLLCQTTVAIDNSVLGRGFDSRPIVRTGKILYHFAANPEKPLDKYLPPPTAGFLLNIVEEYTGEKPQTIEGLAKSTREIGLSFMKINELPKEEQKKLRGLVNLLARQRIAEECSKVSRYGLVV